MMKIEKFATLWCVFAVMCVGPLAAQVEKSQEKQPKPATQEKAAKPALSATQALAAARKIRKGATGKKGQARSQILRAAAAAYEKVIGEHSSDRRIVAAASYAAADIWRAEGDLVKAKALYTKAVEGDATRFAERGTLQLGHVARRQKDLTAAIVAYQKVAKGKPQSARAHEARLWIGRCQVMANKGEEAVKTFSAAIDVAGTPRQAIEACNRLANQLIKMGQLDAAEAAIARAEKASQADPGGTGKNVARRKAGLQRAFAKMSARKALQRKRDKESKAHRDAQDIEKGGSK